MKVTHAHHCKLSGQGFLRGRKNVNFSRSIARACNPVQIKPYTYIPKLAIKRFGFEYVFVSASGPCSMSTAADPSISREAEAISTPSKQSPPLRRGYNPW